LTNEEHTQIIQQIATNLGDQARVTELLTQLSDDYTETTAKLTDYDTRVPQLEQDMESLRSANMKLFLKVGAEIKDPTPPTPPTPPIEKGEEDKDPIANLFNEKGELK
jgi:hypothetical protein